MTDTNRAQQIAVLEREISQLQLSLSTPGLPETVQDTLRKLIAEREALLAALRTTEGRSSALIDFGSNSQFGNITTGDVAGRDIYKGNVTYGPTVTGPISPGGNVYIGTTQHIDNRGSTTPAPATPPYQQSLPPLPPLRLRLALADPSGAALSALTVHAEARLRVQVEGDTAGLPDATFVLEADCPDLEWLTDSRQRLRLQPGSPPRAPLWLVVPQRAGVLNISLSVLHQEWLVQHLQLVVSCVEADAGVLSGAEVPLAEPLQLPAVGLDLRATDQISRSSAENLTLVFTEEDRGYRLLLANTGEAVTLPLTPTHLADLNATARAELLTITETLERGTKIYRRAITVSPETASKTLARLATLGAKLWRSLFNATGSGADSHRIGEQLRALSSGETSLNITIVGDVGGFPWHLLYNGDPTQPDVNGFWGLHHAVALLPVRGRTSGPFADTRLSRSNGLHALAGYHLGLARQPASAHVIDAQRQALDALGFTAQEVHSEPAFCDALAQGTAAQVIYLYCHLKNAMPGQQPVSGGGRLPTGVESTRLILSEGASGLTLADLRLAAPSDGQQRLSAGPLVVLNACGSAALSPLSYDGLAPYLLDQGARAVVGTECDTPVIFGAAFGPALLREFAAGKTIGQALRDTRRAFVDEHLNALGLLYTLYGMPELHLRSEGG